jgi:Arabinose efflux permease
METTYKDLLRIRAFRNLWIGQAISQLGDALYYLVFLFMVDRITGDPRLVGLCGALQALPFLLFGLPAGVVADRVDRRKVLLFADIASAVLLGVLAIRLYFDATPPVWILFAAGFLLSTVNAFFAPAKNAAIPALVPPEKLLTANALSQATQSLMPLIGLGISGSVLGALYVLYPDRFFLSAVVLNGLSFLLSAVFIRRLPALEPERTQMQSDPWRELKDGLRYVRREHVLLMLVVLNVLVQVTISPFMVVYVTVNRAWFGGDYRTLALFEFAFMAGMVASSVAVGRMHLRRPGLAFIGGLAVVGATVAAMAYSRALWLFSFWNFAAGIALPFAQIPMNTYLQTVVPDTYRGRVNALLTMASFGVQPLGAGLAGWLTEQVGIVAMFLLMGIGMGAAALVGLLSRPFRDARLA